MFSIKGQVPHRPIDLALNVDKTQSDRVFSRDHLFKLKLPCWARSLRTMILWGDLPSRFLGSIVQGLV